MFDKDVYIRRLYHHELGFRKEKPGKAGRYFFVSKEFVRYFPPLSKQITNDSVILNFTPPFSNDIVKCNFIYHNDKYTTDRGTRDEYRLYLNIDVDPEGDYYQPNDIVILWRKLVGDQTIYELHHYSSEKHAERYENLKGLLEKYSPPRCKGKHASVPVSEISFLKSGAELAPIKKIIIPEKIKDVVLKSPFELIPEELMKKEFKSTRFIKNSSFRDLVLFFYEEKCAATGTVIKYGSSNNLQVAHIIPDSHRGPPHPKNGLALSRDIHWAFDMGFFTIETDYKIRVHEKVKDIPVLKEIDGHNIFLPSDSRACPSEVALNYHKEKVYGLFEKKSLS